MKKCFKCEETKPLSYFYDHPQMADGHLNKCKTCVKLYAKQRRMNNEYVREYDRQRSSMPHRRAARAIITRRWRAENPQRQRAHELVALAIRHGTLVRQPCRDCGKTAVHAHHDDYTKPLDVVWLCARHHARITHAN